MPFGTKAIIPRPDRAPERINFDALWTKALKPALYELGYEPVRADQDLGASIIHEMIERLYFSDLVVADLSIPNANVYYEIGVRHASRRNGCVLIAADWATPLFDVAQMRRLAYPLPEGEVTDAAAKDIRDALKNGVLALAQGDTPIYTVLPGYPDERAIQQSHASAIRTQLSKLSEFQTRVHAARLERDKQKRKGLVDALIADHHPTRPILNAVAMEMVTLIGDTVGWSELVDYLDQLPANIRTLDVMVEHRALAISKMGNHRDAIAALTQLIQLRGETSERWGLIGGRYKKLYGETKDPADLDQSIHAYERGMRVNLNDYYPSSNLPRLYRMRNRSADNDKATFAAKIALVASSRAKELNANDPWLRPTLLAMAFDAADTDRATELLDEVRLEGHARWKLESLIGDLRTSAGLAPANKRAELDAIIVELEGISKSRPNVAAR